MTSPLKRHCRVEGGYDSAWHIIMAVSPGVTTVFLGWIVITGFPIETSTPICTCNRTVCDFVTCAHFLRLEILFVVIEIVRCMPCM